MTGRQFFVRILLAMAFAITPAQAADQTKPYGRACLALANAEGEKPLDETAQPGEGKSLVVYLDANTPCVALIVALNRKGEGLVKEWQPALVELAAWEPQRLPPKPEAWEWKQAVDAFDVQVFFLDREAPGLNKLRALLTAMARKERDATLVKLQERQLRELLAPWQADDSAVVARPSSAPVRTGGTVRGIRKEFAWRDHAASANFSAERPGVISFRHDVR
jgi:hypothetical protein